MPVEIAATVSFAVALPKISQAPEAIGMSLAVAVWAPVPQRTNTGDGPEL